MEVSAFKREISAALAYAALLIAVAIIAPSFYSAANLRDLALNNAPVLLVAIGMTMVILVAQIDISVGSLFAITSVAAVALVKCGLPMPLVLVCVVMIGATMGAINGALIGTLRLPSIIVTLAMLVAWRDALRWITGGEWVQNLPPNFQWLGLGQSLGQWLIVITSLLVLGFFAWTLRSMAVGRAVYAVGSNTEAARLAGIEPARGTFLVFMLMGALVGLASLLNAVRFSTVPSNAGFGLELKAIAAVVVGGTAITGGRGTLIGTLIGVALLGTIGTALTFIGINPFWEKAIQGAIILAALASDFVLGRVERMRAAQQGA